MLFTEKLYINTKDAHSVVDKHSFVSLIRKNEIAANYYINLNKICIYELQKDLKLKNESLQKELHREIEQPDIFISDNIRKLLSLCKKHSLEAEYMFKGGLIKGGNLLKKYVNINDHPFLTFKNPKELFNQLKDYLDKHVEEHDAFIDNVNNIYQLITLVFDDFYNKCN